ncbi:transposase [Marinomonas sp.]|uniref:transposase n=1 Tax=Marinomonas sp. TaxID=1904862 RepID=UPI003A920F1F
MSFDENSFMGESFSPNRGKLIIEVGSFVAHETSIYRITQVLDFESVVGCNVETGRSLPLRIQELSATNDQPLQSQSYLDIEEISDKDWKEAERRYSIIHPFVDRAATRQDIEDRAEDHKIATSTLYRWLKAYKDSKLLSSLIPKKRGWTEGNTRLSKELEQLIENVIKDYYLKTQRPTIQKTVREVKRVCLLRGISPPGSSAVRERIIKISEKKKLRARGFKEKADNKFTPTPGKFPNANYPLAVIQIDHTPVDLILVDDVYRLPIGKPWITLAIDVYSRMVTGYYLSFDPPSGTSVAMCVAHSILPKEEWLTLHNIEAKWPVWGFPRTIHVDNGADFRAGNFRDSCSMHGIHLEFRPVKVPRYGGHIERLLGTFLSEIHDLPGTTFSSIKDRDGYDSEKESMMSKSEFEEWLIILICKLYHNRKHSNLGMSPFKQWEIGILGNATQPGVGLAPVPTERLSLQLDFLPSSKRTIQTFGTTIDTLTYYSEIMRPWINLTDSETGKNRKYIFRRDLRDISSIWFFEPNLREYFKVPLANQAWPSVSIWEFNTVKEKLKNEGSDSSNEHLVLNALTEMRHQVEESKQRTKKARRQSQRRKEHEKQISPASPIDKSKSQPTLATEASNKLGLDIDLDLGDVEGYGDIA